MGQSQGIAFNNLRTNKKYRLTNYGEQTEFVILDVHPNDFLLKDIHTLEQFWMSELISYGKGEDFSIWEIR